MTRITIAALLVLGTHSAWALNGCPPPSADADKCQMGMTKALSKFGGAVIKCHAKQADGAFKSKPLDDEPCEAVGPKSAKGKLDATITKAAPKCPAEVVTNADAVATSLLSGDASLDVQNGLIYCDPTSGAPIDANGDDAGFIPASKDQLKCADGVGKNIAKLWASIAKCSNKAADAAFKGKTFDEATCRSTATGKYDDATTKLIAGDCPPCLDSGAQASLRDALLTQLDAIDGEIFVCPSYYDDDGRPHHDDGRCHDHDGRCDDDHGGSHHDHHGRDDDDGGSHHDDHHDVDHHHDRAVDHLVSGRWAGRRDRDPDPGHQHLQLGDRGRHGGRHRLPGDGHHAGDRAAARQ